MQDTVSVYEALSPAYAEFSPITGLPTPSCGAHLENFSDMVTVPLGVVRMGSMATLVHADRVQRPLLDR